MSNDVQVRLGRRIKLLREAKAWKQEDLAQESGIGRSHISQLENGRREAGVRVLSDLAQALGVTMSELVDGI